MATTTLKSIFSLMLLLTLIHFSYATRILDEQTTQPIDPSFSPDSPPQPSDSLPDPSDPPTDLPIQPATPPSTYSTAAAPPSIPPSPAIPLAANTGNPATTTTAYSAAEPLTFFMHDILGGTKPSVRIVTGVVASSAVNGQLPFARPNHDIFPIQGALPLPEGANNLINSNNVPYVAGLSGSTTSLVNNNVNPQNANAPSSNSMPYVKSGDLPSGTTLENLLFGTTTVIDDELTEGHEIGSAVIGRAQGFYVASSQDGTSKTILLTACFDGADHLVDDSVGFFGVHRMVAPESHIAVIGGTGKYENAKGFAVVQTLQADNQGTTDGVETLLQFSVHLS